MTTISSSARRQATSDALDDLLRRHHDRIHAVCRRLAGNDADALDATQEALIAIVRGLRRFDGRSAFSTWVVPGRDQRLPRRAAPAQAPPGRCHSTTNVGPARTRRPRPVDRAGGRRPPRHRRRARPAPARVPGTGRAPRPLRPRLRRDRGGARHPARHRPLAHLPGPRRARRAARRSQGTRRPPPTVQGRDHDRRPAPSSTTSPPPTSTAR